MGESNRYALWLAPGEEAESLASLISQLSKKFHGPRFTPHVTLLGRAEGEESGLIKCAEKVAGKIAKFTLNSGELITTPYYFRSFFITLGNAPELLRTRQVASEIFDIRMASGYEPHMSLMYGNLGGRNYNNLIHKIKDSIPESISMVRLQLVRLTVSVSNWEIVGEYPLKG